MTQKVYNVIMDNPFTEHRLDNGLRIVMEVMPGVTSAAAGFLARTGARDETPELAGVSHFLEHMCFKGTPHRTWRQITIDFDEMGSSYNAFTGKDRTFYYGWVPSNSIDRQIALLADMMESTLPTDEFDMERNVVLEEIAMSNDQIENLAYDLIHEKIYGGHPLAHPVLGYDQTIRNLTRDRMWEYLKRRYAPDNLILIAAGKIAPQQIIADAERSCGHWRPAGSPTDRRLPSFAPGATKQVHERFNQQIVVQAYPAPGGQDPWSETAEAVAAILGGENSRFYWQIVQEGLAPRAGVWRVDYSDCGLMVLSAQCEPAFCDEVMEAMTHEAQRLIREGATEDEVQRVKNIRRTHIAVESETPYYRLGLLLDDLEYYGRPRTVAERLAEVDAVTTRRVAEYLERFPITTGGHAFSVGPRDWMPASA